MYSYSTNCKEDRVELYEHRGKYVNQLNIQQFKTELNELEYGNVALLYASGTVQHPSNISNYTGGFECSIEKPRSKQLAIKQTAAYMMHQYAKVLSGKNTITYANINGNTCASSMYSIYEAEQLLATGKYDAIIIIAEDKTAYGTLRTFSECEIDLTVGEGFACLVMTKDGEGTEVTDTKWEFSYDINPFKTTEQGYRKLLTECDIVKGHKTNTPHNTAAEEAAFGDVIGYKHITGHTQGASSAIELCMLVDDDTVSGEVLCTASGLGGFYGSCLVHK